MKKLLFLVVLALVALDFSCTPAAHFAANQLPAKQIRWGSGGGFTGKETSFVLLENGQIFRFKTLDGSAAELASANARAARGFFKKAESLGLRDMKHDRPGNMYFFIELRDAGTAPHRIAWSEQSLADSKALNFYAALQELVR